MATKQQSKAAPPAKAGVATPRTAIVPWQEQMANAAKKQAAAEKPFNSMATIGTRSGVLTVDGDPVKGNILHGIVLASVHENMYYSGRFEPDSPTVPACYAFGDDLSTEDPDGIEDRMTPHKEAEDVQHAGCEGCPHNQMGSADTGRGKACKNSRRLIILPEDALESPEALKAAEMRMLKLPVTSVRNYATYLRTVLSEELNLPSYGVVTSISTHPDPKTQFKVAFELKETVEFNQGLWDAMQAKLKEAEKMLLQPYPKQADLDANAAGKAPAKPLKGQPMKFVKPPAKGAPAKTAARR